MADSGSFCWLSLIRRGAKARPHIVTEDDAKGYVTIALQAMDGATVTIDVDIGAWSRALVTHRRVPAWLKGV